MKLEDFNIGDRVVIQTIEYFGNKLTLLNAEVVIIFLDTTPGVGLLTMEGYKFYPEDVLNNLVKGYDITFEELAQDN